MRAAALLALLTCSCWVGINDTADRACALPEHPCAAGQECFGDHCIPASSFDGWSQDLHGFTGVTATTGDVVDVGADGHLLSARVDPVTNPPRAFARVTARLPQVAAARVGGNITFPAGVGDGFTFASIATRDGLGLLNIGVNPEGLQIDSQPGTLSAAAIINGLNISDYGDTISRVLIPGRESRVEVRWQQGVNVQVWVDGTLLLEPPMSSFTDANAALPGELRLGIEEYYGTVPTGTISAVLSEWVFVPL